MSGKTFNMLYTAVTTDTGRTKVLVFPSLEASRYAQDLLKREFDVVGVRDNVYELRHGTVLVFKTTNSPEWSGHMLRYRGIDGRDTLIDPEVVERRYARVLELWHKYDKPLESSDGT